MTTNQEARQANIRTNTSTVHPMAGDWHALWDDQSIDAGPFNARMLAWINQTLGTSYTNLPGAMHAYAVDRGFGKWTDINDLQFETVVEGPGASTGGSLGLLLTLTQA